MRKADKALEQVRHEAAGCTRCPLYRVGTQTVFGAGPVPAPAMLVGEQPGDQEDLQGYPFVGPAGRLLDRALAEAGVDRTLLYVTNAVKHFKNVPRGKRRIHQKPNTGEIDSCKWWLELELDLVDPLLVVGMGATAARALLGRPIRIGEVRGKPLEWGSGRSLLVTVHPSALLRLRDHAEREREFDRFVRDLASVAELLRA